MKLFWAVLRLKNNNKQLWQYAGNFTVLFLWVVAYEFLFKQFKLDGYNLRHTLNLKMHNIEP